MMRLSICLATYNGAKFVNEQLSSIFSQLSDVDEVVFADDGSSDDTVARVLSFGRQVRVVSTDRVGGVVANFERVLAAAEGDGLVLCDQDDVWLPGRLDLIRERLARSHLVILNGRIVDEDLVSRGQTIFDVLGIRSGFFPNLIKNSFIGCCMAFRRELLNRILPFPVGVPWHDWYIGLVSECTGRVERVDTVTMLYRRHGANSSPTGDKSSYSLLRKLLMRLAVSRAVLIAVLFR